MSFQPRPGSTAAKLQEIEQAAREEAESKRQAREKEQLENKRFWLTFAVALVAALAALGTLVLQTIQLIAC